MKIKLALVEDEEVYLSTLGSLLSSSQEIEVAGLFPTAEALIAVYDKHTFDVVLTDIGLPGINGVACIRQLKPLRPETQFIAFTIFDDDNNVFDAFCAGATGYVLKNSTSAEIIKAIVDVYNGASPMSSSISRKVIQFFTQANRQAMKLPITKRETEILQLLSEGRRYKEISAALFISMDTVRTHIRNIYQKLEVNNKTEAINKYRQ
jgi:DNA-binding NarL/FixJ family response regulator